MMVGDRQPAVSFKSSLALPRQKKEKKRKKSLVLDESGLCCGLTVPLPSCVVG